MKMLQLNVQSPTSTFADIEKAAKTGRADRDARISFATPELLWEVLTLKRWELISLCVEQVRSRYARSPVEYAGM